MIWNSRERKKILKTEEKRQIFWQTRLRKFLPLLEIPLISALLRAFTGFNYKKSEEGGWNEDMNMGRRDWERERYVSFVREAMMERGFWRRASVHCRCSTKCLCRLGIGRATFVSFSALMRGRQRAREYSHTHVKLQSYRAFNGESTEIRIYCWKRLW